MADITLPSHPLFLPEADSYLTRFTVPQTYNYSVLLVDPASHTLYVGARDTIFALSLPFSGERPRRVRNESGEDPRLQSMWLDPQCYEMGCVFIITKYGTVVVVAGGSVGKNEYRKNIGFIISAKGDGRGSW